MDKKFPEWMRLKAALHEKQSREPDVYEGDVWWACIGENIGKEINGKSQKFSRPVIIYKRLAKGFYLIIPATTQQKYGTWYVPYSHKGVKAVACLQQIRTIDHRRLGTRLGRLHSLDFHNITNGFRSLYY